MKPLPSKYKAELLALDNDAKNTVPVRKRKYQRGFPTRLVTINNSIRIYEYTTAIVRGKSRGCHVNRVTMCTVVVQTVFSLGGKP